MFFGICLLSLGFSEVSSTYTNEQKVAAANFEFGLDMYKQMTTEFGNIFISPLSISTALGMVFLGAEGNTKTEMKSVMKWGSVDSFLHESMNKTMAEMNSGGKDYILAIANRLYTNKSGGPIKSAYLTKAEAFYNAEPEKVDFCKKTETAKLINDWVSSKTNNKIKDLVSEGALSCGTLSVLVNAVYFNGTWKYKFDKRFTKEKSFITIDGKNIETPMMELNPSLDNNLNNLRNFKVHKGDHNSIDAQILQLPYKGDNLSMYIVLPNAKDGLKTVESQVTVSKLNQIIDNQMFAANDYNKIIIPKFTLKLKYSLKKYFQNLGMKDLFLPVCNLSGMTDTDVFVSDIFHDTYVDVNEEGTEAAGATSIIIGVTSVRKPSEFVADHPFMYFIRDERSKSVLFYGRYTDPSNDGKSIIKQPNSVKLQNPSLFAVSLMTILGIIHLMP